MLSYSHKANYTKGIFYIPIDDLLKSVINDIGSKGHSPLGEIEVLYSDVNSKKQSDRENLKHSANFRSINDQISRLHLEANSSEADSGKKIGFYTKAERMLKIRRYKEKVKRWLLKKRSGFGKNTKYRNTKIPTHSLT